MGFGISGCAKESPPLPPENLFQPAPSANVGAAMTPNAASGKPAALFSVNGYQIQPGADLHGANLAGADLTGADLSGANLVNANLTGAKLNNTNLAGANLSGAVLDNAELVEAYLDKANFSSAHLEYAKIEWVRGPSSFDFSNAYLRYATLSMLISNNSIFKDANLRDTFIYNAWFENNDFHGAVFTNAIIDNGSGFYKSSGVDLTGAKYRDVCMPDGSYQSNFPTP